MAVADGTARSAVILIGLRTASAVLALAMQMLLARLMPQDDYGLFVLAWAWLLVLATIGAAGFSESALRFLPRYQSRGRSGDAAGFLRTALAVAVATSLCISACLAVTALVLLPDGPARLVTLIIAAGLPFLAAEFVLEGVARASGWYVLTTAPTYILRPLLIGGGAFVIFALGMDLDARLAGLLLIASLVIVAAGLAMLVLRRTSGTSHGRPSHARRRLWWTASVPLVLVAGFDDLLAYSDILLLGLLVPPDSVAVYFAAARAMALAAFVQYAFTMVAGRGFSLAAAAGNSELLQSRVLSATRMTFWSTLAAVAATLAAGPVVLAAFGEGFRDGHEIMVILGLAFMIRALAGQSADLVAILGHARLLAAVSALALAANALVTVGLVPLIGIAGAAWGTVIAMTLRTIILVVIAQRKTGINVADLRPESMVHRTKDVVESRGAID